MLYKSIDRNHVQRVYAQISNEIDEYDTTANIWAANENACTQQSKRKLI